MEETSIDMEFKASLEGIKTVGRYEIIRELGQGGSGIVYLGRDPYIKRDVAIKVSPTTTEISRERFLVEAQSAGRFNHPNIVATYDVGVQGDFCYLTMEFIEGATLEKYCHEDTLLPLDKGVTVFLHVCGALDYAHKQGIIHRDIKPATIMIDNLGTTKVTDFGVAQMTENTAPTGIFGTLSYMSPEQLKDEPLGCQSDIFSLGCVLYELLVGKQAFPGNNNFSTIYKITSEEPESMLSIRQDLPKIMEEITKKALAKDPTERYQSCMEFAYDLRVALRGITGSIKYEKIKDVVDYVHQLTFFNNFTEDQVREIVSLSNIIKANKGKVIVSEGDIDDTFYIVLSGQVKVTKDSKDIALIGTGDCFGEMALISGQSRVANVAANTDCILLKISASLLDNASDSLKYFFYKHFAITLAHRLSQASTKD
jgi:serine/threonine-protein kinase